MTVKSRNVWLGSSKFREIRKLLMGNVWWATTKMSADTQAKSYWGLAVGQVSLQMTCLNHLHNFIYKLFQVVRAFHHE